MWIVAIRRKRKLVDKVIRSAKHFQLTWHPSFGYAYHFTNTFINNEFFQTIATRKEQKERTDTFSVNKNCYRQNMVKKKVMSLLPSLRERKRYLAFEVISKRDIKDSKLVSNLIKTNCLKFLGELGMAKAGIQIIKYENNKGLIRINHKHLDEVRASLALINEKDTIFTSLGVSGIIKKAENKYLRGA
jgi:ribonuclease P/MRP protein subunit POP5